MKRIKFKECHFMIRFNALERLGSKMNEKGGYSSLVYVPLPSKQNYWRDVCYALKAYMAGKDE